MVNSIIKYVEVKFNDLPKQDYAKAKYLVDNLTVGQYVQGTTVNNIQDFNNYIDILARERGIYFIVKKAEVGSTYKVLNNGYMKSKFTFDQYIEKFTM